jgi:hypothetical protein
MVRSGANVVFAPALSVSTSLGADLAGEAPAVVHYSQVSKFDNPAVLVQRIERAEAAPVRCVIQWRSHSTRHRTFAVAGGRLCQ